MDFNNAINPKTEEELYPIDLMPCRSGAINKAIARKESGGIGGCTDLKTGTVWVPTGDTAKERTIRYHEALHASYTPHKATPRDMLDQALEDARLHRHCSVSAESVFQQARQDELAVAVEELTQVAAHPVLTPVHSLMVLRAMAMLQASPMQPEHKALLGAVLSRLGKRAEKDFATAIALLSDIGQWDKARKAVGRYFGKDFTATEPTDGIGNAHKPDGKGKGTSKPATVKAEPLPPVPEPEHKESVPAPDTDSDSDTDSDGDSDSDSDSDGDGDGDEGDEDSTDSGDSGDGISGSADSDTPTTLPDTPPPSGSGGSGGSEPEPEDEDEDEPEEPIAIAPVIPTPKPKVEPPSTDPEEYTADLTPECDRKEYEAMRESHPLKLFIRRMDMGCNRVKLSMGRRAPLPVISGRKILAGRLAGARCNPAMRVFARSINTGGCGTILIDASGSMAIPEDTLIEFLSKAPALTLAFYNAPSDSYGDETITYTSRGKTYTTHSGHCKHGNIYIYAANGYRASAPSIAESAPEYGGGNMIDYQAMAWLIKQPSPRYMVTDSGYTGPWNKAAHKLERKLVDNKAIQIVKGLSDMAKILEELD